MRSPALRWRRPAQAHQAKQRWWTSTQLHAGMCWSISSPLLISPVPPHVSLNIEHPSISFYWIFFPLTTTQYVVCALFEHQLNSTEVCAPFYLFHDTCTPPICCLRILAINLKLKLRKPWHLLPQMLLSGLQKMCVLGWQASVIWVNMSLLFRYDPNLRLGTLIYPWYSRMILMEQPSFHLHLKNYEMICISRL